MILLFFLSTWLSRLEHVVCSCDIPIEVCRTYSTNPKSEYIYVLNKDDTFYDFFSDKTDTLGEDTRVVISELSENEKKNPKNFDDELMNSNERNHLFLDLKFIKIQLIYDIRLHFISLNKKPTKISIDILDGTISNISLKNVDLSISTDQASISPIGIHIHDNVSSLKTDEKIIMINLYYVINDTFYLGSDSLTIGDNLITIQNVQYNVPKKVNILQVVVQIDKIIKMQDDISFKITLNDQYLSLNKILFNISSDILVKFNGFESYKPIPINGKRPLYYFFEDNKYKVSFFNEPDVLNLGIYKIMTKKNNEYFTDQNYFFRYQNPIFSDIVCIFINQIDYVYFIDCLVYVAPPEEISLVFDNINKKTSTDKVLLDIFLYSYKTNQYKITFNSFPIYCTQFVFSKSPSFLKGTLKFDILVAPKITIYKFSANSCYVTFFGDCTTVIEEIGVMNKSSVSGNTYIRNLKTTCFQIPMFYGNKIEILNIYNDQLFQKSINFVFLNNGYRINSNGLQLDECIFDQSRMVIGSTNISLNFKKSCDVNFEIDDIKIEKLSVENFFINKTEPINKDVISFQLISQKWLNNSLQPNTEIRIKGLPEIIQLNYKSLMADNVFFVNINTNEKYNKYGVVKHDQTHEEMTTISTDDRSSIIKTDIPSIIPTIIPSIIPTIIPSHVIIPSTLLTPIINQTLELKNNKKSSKKKTLELFLWCFLGIGFFTISCIIIYIVIKKQKKRVGQFSSAPNEIL